MMSLLRTSCLLAAALVIACGAPLSAAVTIASVDTTNANPMTGNTFINITGTGFLPGATILIGNNGSAVAATAFWTSSSTAISCVTPPSLSGAGLVPIQVINPDGTNAISGITGVAAPIYSQPAPTITANGLVPDAGPFAGSQAVVANGTGFSVAVAVMVAGQQVYSGAPVSAQVIDFTTAAMTASPVTMTVPVVVVNNDGQCGISTYVYDPAPLIGSVSPDASVLAGGSAFTITGANFSAGTTVTVDGLSASPVVLSASSISCTAPALASTPTMSTTVPLVVTNSDGQVANGSFTYTADAFLTITAVTPAAGPVSTSTPITITGTGFDGNTALSINGTAVTVTLTSSTSLSASTPASITSPGVYPLLLTTTDDGQTAMASFAYQGTPPTITGLTPAYAPAGGGTTMVITGSGFTASTVTIGGASASAVTIVSSSEITCVTPPGTPGPATVTVINGDLTSASAPIGAFTYQNATLPPTITALVPGSGPVGTVVSIQGTNFTVNPQVLIGSVQATGVTWLSADLIFCTIPAVPMGPQTVTVINSDSLSAIAVAAFTVNNGPGEAHKKCGGHGISAMLLAPLMLWGLFLRHRSGRRSRPVRPSSPRQG